MLSKLKALPQWVCYRADKIPLRPIDGKPASVTQPFDWATYEFASQCVSESIGIGFVLTDTDPFTFIDLDNPEGDETITKNQMEVFNAFDSYSEISPSGKGLHIIVEGSVPSGKRKPGIEVYSSGRYMTVTQNAYQNKPIKYCQAELNDLYNSMGEDKPAAVAFDSKPETQSDDEVLLACASGKNGNGDKFKQLYEGKWSGITSSASEADLIIVNTIAFYTDSKEQTARIFRNSPAANATPARKKKTKRDDYLFHEKWGIVAKAFDNKMPEIDFSQMVINGAKDYVVEVEPIKDWTVPPGLVGDIAKFIYANAVNPVKEVAIAAAISYFAGICGRSFNYSQSGLNQYIILLANSGGGKEGASQGIDRLNKAVREQVPGIDKFTGPGAIASPQALIKYIAQNPCFVSHIDEIGHWLQKLCAKYAKQNETSLRGLLLALFSKSGAGQSVKSSIFADSVKNVSAIESPAMTIFGDSTHKEFYKALDEDNLSEGLVSRFTVIESVDVRPTFNKLNNKIEIPKDLIWKLGSVARRCMELEQLNQVINIEQTEEAEKFHLQFREQCTDEMFKDRESALGNIWNRAHLRVLRLAGLLAVGQNPDNPVVTITELMWAKDLVLHGIEMVTKRFAAGQVGETSYALEQRIATGRVIHKYYVSGWRDLYLKSYGITKSMYDSKVIPHRYLQIALCVLACFKNDRNSVHSLRVTIDEFINAGNLVKVDMKSVKASGKSGVAYYIVDAKNLLN